MISKGEVIQSFDPNAPGTSGNLFGLPFSIEHSEVIIVPVPWEVTVSYQTGTAQGPQAILDASAQVDLFVRDIADAWKLGIAMQPVPKNILEESTRLRELSSQYIESLEEGAPFNPANPVLTKINEACENLNIYVKSTTQRYLKDGKLVGLLGGDHSTPLGFIRALSERYDRHEHQSAICQTDRNVHLVRE